METYQGKRNETIQKVVRATQKGYASLLQLITSFPCADITAQGNSIASLLLLKLSLQKLIRQKKILNIQIDEFNQAKLIEYFH